MSDWTWKQLVAENVIRISNENGCESFRLADLYQYESEYRSQFPGNHHPREKIRQTLQQLRDLGLVDFHGGGKYRLNCNFDDVEQLEINQTSGEVFPPDVCITQRLVRLRNTVLASTMKSRYQHLCQICRETVALADRNYSEAHHIRPLGDPHAGLDIEGNILVLCPNHHVMLDRGAVSIHTETLVVEHIRGAFTPRKLHLSEWHSIDLKSLTYYTTKIMQQ